MTRPTNGPTREQLLEAYPGIPDALEWGENHEGGDTPVWEVARKAGIPPERVVRMCQMSVEVALLVGSVRACPHVQAEAERRAAKIREQFKHPSFLAYVRAKLGAI